MLDQLVESKSHAGEGSQRNGLLVGTFILLTVILLGAWVVSLGNKVAEFLATGLTDELSLETLVAPPIIEEAPEPEPEEPKDQQKAPNADVRTEIIASMTETPPKPPDTVSVVKNTVPPRDPDRYTVLGKSNINADNPPPPGYDGPVNNQGTGSNSGNFGTGGDGDSAGAAPPPAPPKPRPVPKQISGGVLNGKATSLPKPPYPPAARAVRASGAVSVQVLISESGSVVSASAVSGHPLLRAAAVQAARGARFSPTMLSGQPVKVSGVITYNFVT